jgi:hypothetical protein
MQHIPPPSPYTLKKTEGEDDRVSFSIVYRHPLARAGTPEAGDRIAFGVNSVAADQVASVETTLSRFLVAINDAFVNGFRCRDAAVGTARSFDEAFEAAGQAYHA